MVTLVGSRRPRKSRTDRSRCDETSKETVRPSRTTRTRTWTTTASTVSAIVCVLCSTRCVDGRFFPHGFAHDLHRSVSSRSSTRTTTTPSWTRIARGGADAVRTNDVEDDEDDEDEEAEEKRRRDAAEVLAWRTEQHQLLQLRSTFLSEALSKRFGVPLTTMEQVSTLESDRPPEVVDWDCAVSTERNPKSCLYSFDAQPGTKVVAPVGTDQYITLSALNRLRRTDPSKVEPMWHGRYAVLGAWFGSEDDSPHVLSRFAGWQGFLVSDLLLNAGALRALLVVAFAAALGTSLPVLAYAVNRLTTSGLFWSRYDAWSRFWHAAFPLKLMLAQTLYGLAASRFAATEAAVRNRVVEWECRLLEESVPVTVTDETEDEEADDVVMDVSEEEDEEDDVVIDDDTEDDVDEEDETEDDDF